MHSMLQIRFLDPCGTRAFDPRARRMHMRMANGFSSKADQSSREVVCRINLRCNGSCRFLPNPSNAQLDEAERLHSQRYQEYAWRVGQSVLDWDKPPEPSQDLVRPAGAPPSMRSSGTLSSAPNFADVFGPIVGTTGLSRKKGIRCVESHKIIVSIYGGKISVFVSSNTQVEINLQDLETQHCTVVYPPSDLHSPCPDPTQLRTCAFTRNILAFEALSSTISALPLELCE